jgi:hypothetical protein
MEGKGEAKEGKKRNQSDAAAVAAKISASGTAEDAAAAAAAGGGGGSKSAVPSESAKAETPRTKRAFPDPVPVKASVLLRGAGAAATGGFITVDAAAQCIREGEQPKYTFDTILPESASLEDVYQARSSCPCRT